MADMLGFTTAEREQALRTASLRYGTRAEDATQCVHARFRACMHACLTSTPVVRLPGLPAEHAATTRVARPASQALAPAVLAKVGLAQRRRTLLDQQGDPDGLGLRMHAEGV